MRTLRMLATLWAAIVIAARPAIAQQLGYKLLGSAGIDAGVQSPPGLFLIDRVLQYGANQLRDKNGRRVPIDGLDIGAVGNAFGAAYTVKAARGPYLTFALSVPLARIHVNSDNPGASLSGYGFADLFVQPLRVGWREGRFDVVTAYMAYIPTGKFEPRGGGVGRGYWTHEFSAGGAIYFDSTRTGRASALVSYEINTRKRGIDVRRGSMVQVQGGAGVGVAKVLTLGIAGYGTWQATPDRGADIPPVLRGQWSRAFGIGPEIDITIPRLRLRADVRVEREFGVRARPQGQVIAAGVSYLLWRPRP